MGLAGIVFVCTALSYAELSSVYHESGGSASFARHAFNDVASFIAGWGLLLDYIVTIAISAFAIAPYLAIFAPLLNNVAWHISFACGIIAILYVLNFFGVKRSTKTSMFLALFAIVTQVLIIGIGCMTLLNFGKVFSQMRIGVVGASWSPTWSQFLHGVAMAMVAYTGIESIAQLGSESFKPAKNLPRAMFLNMVVLLLMYLGISVVGLSVVSAQELGTTYIYNPVSAIANALPFGGNWLMSWVGILGAILLFVASNAGLIGSSRLAYNMSEYYQLPRFFSGLHPKFRTPHIALLFFAILAIIIIILSRGRLSFLADLYNFGAMIAFFSTNLSLIVLRVKQKEMKRPFAIPLNLKIFGYKIPISAIVGCIATLSVWVLIVLTKLEGRLIGLSWMLLGIGMFLIYRRRKGLVVSSITVEKITIPHLEPLQMNRVLVSTQSRKDNDTIQLACEVAKRHKAKLTIVYVMEIPITLPVDAVLPSRVSHAESVLKRSEESLDSGISPSRRLSSEDDFSIPLFLALSRRRKSTF